jgi:hypothetical protein
MASFTTIWELFGDFLDATHRFTSGATPPAIALTQLIDDTVTLTPGTTRTVWDAGTSALPAFDFLYVAAAEAGVLVEVTGTVSAAPQTQLFELLADALPFLLTSDLFYATLGGTAGLVTKVRVNAPSANTVNAMVRYGVGLA